MPFDTNIGGSPALNLNKIEHFSKVSVLRRVTRQHSGICLLLCCQIRPGSLVNIFFSWNLPTFDLPIATRN